MDDVNTNDQGESEQTAIALGSNLSISQVSDLHEKFLDIIREPESVVIDASEIEHTDTAGLQCLYSFKVSMDEEGTPVSWDAPSDAFIKAAQLLGMREHLGL